MNAMDIIAIFVVIFSNGMFAAGQKLHHGSDYRFLSLESVLFLLFTLFVAAAWFFVESVYGVII